jgi:hypothetical protein
MDRKARRALIAAALIFAVALAAVARPDDPRAAYNQWIAKYAAKSLDGNILEITLIEDAPTELQSSTYTFTVKPDGQVWWDSFSAFGSKGGSGNPVATESLNRLEDLDSRLPADAGSLPPPERRILIQTPRATRVYDRAELPDPVTELLRLSNSGIGSWQPRIETQSKIDARAYGLLALLPDGKRILCGTQMLAIPTYEPLGDLEGVNGYDDIAFSPDGMLVATSAVDCLIVDTSTLKLIRNLSEPRHDGQPPLGDPHITPDGHCLVLRAGDNSGLRFFDTKTWEQVGPVPGIPADALQWKPSKSWRHAVTGNKPLVVSLWDAKSKSARQLDPMARLLDVAFSPDESQVAVVTSDKDGYSNPRLRIFQTDTGALVHELRPGEIGCDRLRFPQWTADGRYVLAVTKPDSFFSDENVSLWNANTGRHRADFVGCVAMSNFLLLPPGDQLVATSNNGTLHIWDFKAAMQKISVFEQSLAASQTP